MAKDKDDKEGGLDVPQNDGPRGGDHGGNSGGAGPGHEGDDHGPGNGDHGQDKTIVIFVNEKPVEIEKERQTGLSIKQAAIAQGLQI